MEYKIATCNYSTDLEKIINSTDKAQSPYFGCLVHDILASPLSSNLVLYTVIFKKY